MKKTENEIRDEVLEEAARIVERMVVGGRAWTESQAVAAKILFVAAESIRANKSSRGDARRHGIDPFSMPPETRS